MKPRFKRMHYKHGSWYYITPGERRWIRLASELDEAERVLLGILELEGAEMPSVRRVRWQDFDWDKSLLKQTITNARTKNLPHALTREWLTTQMVQQNGCCAITGLPFYFETDPRYTKRPWVPSVDRIDRTQGYLPQNCRLVAAAVNIALNEWGLDVLETIASALQQARRRRRAQFS